VAQEIPLNLNKSLPQFRESGMRQVHAPNSVIFFQQTIPNPTIFLFQDQTPSPSSSFVVNDPAAEIGDGRTQNQSLLEEIQVRLKEIFACEASPHQR
jgi:hypothetical protein